MLEPLTETLRNLNPMRSIDPDLPVLDEDALETATESDDVVVVCFYADWCGFSRSFLPAFEQRVQALDVPAALANISPPSDPRWSTYDIDTVPSIVAFEDGEEVARVDGRAGRGLGGEDLDRLENRLEA